MRFVLLIIFTISFTSCTEKSIKMSESEFSEPTSSKLLQTAIYNYTPSIENLTIGKSKKLNHTIKDEILNTEESELPEPKFEPLIKPETAKLYFSKDYKLYYKTVELGEPEIITSTQPQTSDLAITNIKFYGQDQGLIGTVAKCMAIDSHDRLWVGTDAGLCCFDGQTWSIYNVKSGLSTDYIYSVYENSNGEILVGTYSGLNVINLEKKIITQISDQHNIDFSAINYINENNNEEIIVLSGKSNTLVILNLNKKTKKVINSHNNNKKVTCITKKDNDSYFIGYKDGIDLIDFNKQTNQSFNNNPRLMDIQTLCVKKNSDLLIGTKNGLIEVQFKQKKIKTVNEHRDAFNFEINTIINESDDKIIIGSTNNGIKIYDFLNNKTTNLSAKQGLSNNIITAIYKAKNDKILIGTEGGGLNILDNISNKTKVYKNQFGIYNETISSIAESGNGKLLFIGTNGNGLYILDKKNNTKKHYTQKDGLPSDNILTISTINNSQLLISTIQNGACILNYKNDFLDIIISRTLNAITNVINTDSNTIIVSTYYDGLSFLNLKSNNLTTINEKSGVPVNEIFGVASNSEGKFFLGTFGKGLIVIDTLAKTFKNYTTKEGLSSNQIFCLMFYNQNLLFIGTIGGGLDILDLKTNRIRNYSLKQGLESDQILSIVKQKNDVWLGTGKGLFKMTENNNEFFVEKKIDKEDGLKNLDFNPNSALITKKGDFYFGTGDILTEFTPSQKTDTTPLHTYIKDILINDKKTSWVSDNQNKLSFFEANPNDTLWVSSFSTFETKYTFTVNTDNLNKNKENNSELTKPYFIPKSIELPYNENHITFNYNTIYIGADSKKIKYRYFVDGFENTWGNITDKTEADYKNMLPGNYTFKVSSRFENGKWNSPVEFKFTINPPWWKTYWAYFSYIIFSIISIVLIVNWRTKSLKNKQIHLEQIIEERTTEVTEQKNKVEEKQKEIVDSINYANRIQHGLLSNNELLKSNLENYFVLFKPKDIVSGDFHWCTCRTINKKDGTSEELFYLAVCDSTGHGVPGAFMSLLNIGFLSEAINEKRIIKPNEIFNYVRNRLIETISNDGQSGQDGMDGILICKGKNSNSISYAAANNEPILIRKNEIVELPKDKMPVGKGESNSSFKLQKIELSVGDSLYLYTDGYADQFGGPKGKKFKYKQLNELLLKISKLEVSEQQQILKQELENWQGDLEQVDDICIIGIKI